MSEAIKRGTEITPDRLQDILVRIYKKLNEIPTSNIVLSTKQFRDLYETGAYKDSDTTGGKEYLIRYYTQVKQLEEM